MDTLARCRWVAVKVFWISLLGSLGLIGVEAGLGHLGHFHTQLLFALIGLFTLSIVVRIATAGWESHRALAWVTLVLAAVAQVAYLTLIWTRWIGQPALWRLWWIAMVFSVTTAHLLMVARVTGKGRDGLAWITAGGAAVSGLWVSTLGLRSAVPPHVGPVFLWVYGVAAFASVVGSLVLWRREVKRRGPKPPMSRLTRTCWLIATHAGLFLAGFYIARGSRADSPFDDLPAALAGLTGEQLEAQIRSDFERLKTVADGLDALERKGKELQERIVKDQQSQGRQYYTPQEDDEIRWTFVTYLSYRSALLRLVATYANFPAVRDPDAQARCFTIGYAAATTAYKAALTFITSYGSKPALRRKLNEAEPIWGLPAGMFERIYEGAASRTNLEQVHEFGAHYAHLRASWRASAVWPPEAFDWLDAQITTTLDAVKRHDFSRSKAWLASLVDRVKRDAYSPIYTAQSMLSTWIGDTKMIYEAPLISTADILRIQPRLRPGDILLERRNWYLSNAFLPGFWPHGALYVGSHDDLKRLGVADHPDVRLKLDAYLKPARDGRACTVIESVSEGVIFNSLTASMHADYVAVLRPRLPPEKIAQAVARAFSHQGKPYDFEFDFFTSDKIVCTELIYRSYQGLIGFDLVRVMGRDTLPAIELVRKFAKERSSPDPQLEFVLFLDGVPGEKRVIEADAEAFCSSLDRQKVFTE